MDLVGEEEEQFVVTDLRSRKAVEKLPPEERKLSVPPQLNTSVSESFPLLLTNIKLVVFGVLGIRAPVITIYSFIQCDKMGITTTDTTSLVLRDQPTEILLKVCLHANRCSHRLYPA